MKILVLNAGSSSHKSCLYEVGDHWPQTPPEPLWKATVEGIGTPEGAHLYVVSARGRHDVSVPSRWSRYELIAHILESLWSGEVSVISGPGDIDAVGHRVVHGGDYHESVQVTAQVEAEIARLSELAPVHNPINLQGIETVRQLMGRVPQVAAFDTAFHAHLPDAAAIYPGPYEWTEQGIRRYGFHGISHSYCATRAAQVLGRDLKTLRLVVCHLGNGCSLAAIRDGRSVDTTMGFTPLEGLMMGSRSGSIDPGLLLHLVQQRGYRPADLERILNYESGLKGLSGISGDMREVCAAHESGHERARLALDVYIHRLRFHIGAMLPALGGLDALVFTAGVGQNSAWVRSEVCRAFEFIGLRIDEDKNALSPIDADIATPNSNSRVLVVETQEDWAIAHDCWEISRRESRTANTARPGPDDREQNLVPDLQSI